MSIAVNRTGTRIIVDRTDRRDGALVSGGLCGRRISYRIADAEAATGLARADLLALDPYDLCAILREMGDGRVVRRGEVVR